MAWRSAVGIELDEAERCELEARTRRRKISRADAMRAEIVLLAADGASNLAIAKQLGVTRVMVATWRKRFAATAQCGEELLIQDTSGD
jgi:transposase